jgi:hypothetical protein
MMMNVAEINFARELLHYVRGPHANYGTLEAC